MERQTDRFKERHIDGEREGERKEGKYVKYYQGEKKYDVGSEDIEIQFLICFYFELKYDEGMSTADKFIS